LEINDIEITNNGVVNLIIDIYGIVYDNDIYTIVRVDDI
jgi:hypothetical protein